MRYQARTGCTLERNILVRDRPRCSRLGFGSALVEIVPASARGMGGSARASGKIAASAALAASAQQDDVAGHNFGHVFLLAGSFVVPRAGLQTSLDVNLPALLQILPGNLCQALPEHHVVPLGAILPLAGFVFEALVGGDGQLGHGCALRRVFDFGILAQISDQLNPVQTLASHVGAPLLGFTIAEWARWRSCAYRKLRQRVSFWAGPQLRAKG